MNNLRIFISFVLVLGILIGCNTVTDNTKDSQDVNLTKISTQGDTYNQSDSNRAKEFLSQKESVIAVQAVNTSKKILITVEIPHHERFQLEKIRKDLEKDMKKKFPKLDVELSTDKKIILELEDLEKKLRENNISNKKLEKELNHIIKLSKEQT